MSMYIEAIDIKSVVGKTIEKASDWCEYISLQFTDGTGIVLKGGEYYDQPEIFILHPDQLNMAEKWALDLITEEDYDAYEKRQEQIRRNEQIECEREQYKRLHAKFGGGMWVGSSEEVKAGGEGIGSSAGVETEA